MNAVFRMSIGADLDEVAKVLAAFGRFADSEGLPDSARRAAFVVLDELLANTVSHGLEGRDDGIVTVEVSWAPGRLTLTVSDNGLAFDPFARGAPDTTLSIEDRPIGGLGIHLVKQLVDDVSYRRDGHHNIVVLTMRTADKDSSVISDKGQ